MRDRTWLPNALTLVSLLVLLAVSFTARQTALEAREQAYKTGVATGKVEGYKKAVCDIASVDADFMILCKRLEAIK